MGNNQLSIPIVLFSLALTAAGAAALEPAARCQVDRHKTLGWAAKCEAAVVMRAVRRFLPPDAVRLQRCEDRFVTKFAKIEDRANGTCRPALGDATAVLDAWRACVQPVGASLGGPMGVGNDTDWCQSMKIKEAGRYADCRFTAQSKAHRKGVTPDFSRCDDKLDAEFAKLELRGPCAGMVTPLSSTSIATKPTRVACLETTPLWSWSRRTIPVPRRPYGHTYTAADMVGSMRTRFTKR